MIGKVPAELLEALVVDRTGEPDDRVLQGPAYGEDTAAIAFDDEIVLVNTDPISLAVERIGTLGVHVVCNDIAASGGTPEWLTSVIFLPDSSEARLDTITEQLDTAARELGVSIVGGHTEYAPALSDPMVVLTCFGLTDEYIPTGGAAVGDRVLLTKGAGIEGTAILASDFEADVEASVSPEIIERGKACYDDIGVNSEAAIVADDANAMHDPTEGGVLNGLIELAVAAGKSIEIDPDSIPIRTETAELCRAVGVDPLRIFGSGALLATVPPAAVDRVAERLDSVDIEHAVIGTVRATEGEEPTVSLGSERLTAPIRDEMYALWE